MSYRDANGVLVYEESDLATPGGLFSALLNAGFSSVSEALAAIKALIGQGGGGGGSSRPIYRPEDYGTVDPTGAQDSRAAINAAMAAAETFGGGIVQLTAGKFLVSYALTGRTGVLLRGAGKGATTVKLQDGNLSTGANFFIYRASGKKHARVEGITWDGGTGHTTGNTATIGIAFNSCEDAAVLDCDFINTRRSIYVSNFDGIAPARHEIARNTFAATTENIAIDCSQSGDVIDANIHHNVIHGIVKQNPALDPWTAIYVRGQHNNVESNIVHGSADTAIMVTSPTTTDTRIHGNDVTANQVAIYHGQGALNPSIVANIVRSIRDHGMHLDSGDAANQSQSMGGIIQGNRIPNPGKNGINLEGVNDMSILGNIISNPASLRPTRPDITYENEWAGIAVESAPSGAGGGENVLIDDNQVYDDRADKQMSAAVAVGSGSAIVTIGSGNRFRGSRLANIIAHANALFTVPPVVGNRDPKASYTYTRRARRVTFVPTIVDTDGAIASTLWGFGDGSTSTDAAPTHLYPRNTSGTFASRVVARDDKGAMAIAKATVDVTPRLNDGFSTANGASAPIGSTILPSTLPVQAWRILGPGTWVRGVSGGARPGSGSSRTMALLNAGAGERVSVAEVLAPQASTPVMELTFRVKDLDNYWVVRLQGGVWALRNRINGVDSAAETLGVNVAAGDLIEVYDNGTDRFEVFINGVSKIAKTTTDLAAYTESGLSGVFSSDGSSTWNYFEIH